MALNQYPGLAPSAPSSATSRSSDPPAASRTKKPSPLRFTLSTMAALCEIRVEKTPIRVPLYARTNQRSSHYPPTRVSYSSSDTSSSSGSILKPAIRTNASRPESSLPKAALKHRRKGSRPRLHVSFVDPKRSEPLNMHPLFAHDRLDHAPIYYDVRYPPSTRSVLDRTTRTAVPLQTLSQPATDTSDHRLILESDKFPWPIHVSSPSGSKGPGRGFKRAPITNFDALHALHAALLIRVTPEEWASTPKSKQRKITRAYEKRCIGFGGDWDSGVRRIDWLGDKTRLAGVEVHKNAKGDDIAKLVFKEL